MTAPELLRHAGQLLYGGRWHTELADDLDVSDRTIRRWMNDGAPIPPGIRDDLRRIVERRIKRLENFLATLP
jgi:hypothetical protein